MDNNKLAEFYNPGIDTEFANALKSLQRNLESETELFFGSTDFKRRYRPVYRGKQEPVDRQIAILHAFMESPMVGLKLIYKKSLPDYKMSNNSIRSDIEHLTKAGFITRLITGQNSHYSITDKGREWLFETYASKIHQDISDICDSMPQRRRWEIRKEQHTYEKQIGRVVITAYNSIKSLGEMGAYGQKAATKDFDVLSGNYMTHKISSRSDK